MPSKTVASTCINSAPNRGGFHMIINGRTEPPCWGLLVATLALSCLLFVPKLKQCAYTWIPANKGKRIQQKELIKEFRNNLNFTMQRIRLIDISYSKKTCCPWSDTSNGCHFYCCAKWWSWHIFSCKKAVYKTYWTICEYNNWRQNSSIIKTNQFIN